MRKVFLLFIIIAAALVSNGQSVPVFKDATTANRQRLYSHLVNNTIHKNLSSPLSDSTEDRWEDAFYALELIHYKDAITDQKIRSAANDMQNRSISFQRALLELLYTNYQQVFARQVRMLLEKTDDPKIFVMCGDYLLNAIKTPAEKNTLLALAKNRSATNMTGPLTEQFLYDITSHGKKITPPSIHTLLKKDYLPGNVLLISFQRKNRNYPGLVMVRDTSGNFEKDTSGFFSVPQLARSINNLPGYITNGNTPEGLFRMDGFDVSKGSMIGPTTNIQLTMPFEFNAFHFYRDSTLADTIGNITLYKNLLPKNFREYYPMQQSFHAGKAGRTEIIAHGTTIDPAYYKGMPWYPLTPTVGCLCTKEIWSGENGKRLQSDQQALINAITAAGGPQGYAIVINIDDKQAPVTIKDIMPFLKIAGVVLPGKK